MAGETGVNTNNAALQAALAKAREAAAAAARQRQQQQATAQTERTRLLNAEATQAAQGSASADSAERNATAARENGIDADTFFREYDVQAQDQQQAVLEQFDADKSGTFDEGEWDSLYNSVTAEAPTHTVASGDSLSAIAASYTGNPEDYQALHAANQDVIGGDPNVIHPGQELQVPQEFVDTKTVREAQLPEHGEVPRNLPEEDRQQIRTERRAADDQVARDTAAAFNNLPPERQAQVQAQMDTLKQEYNARYGEGAFDQLSQPTGGAGNEEANPAATESLATSLQGLEGLQPNSPEYAAALTEATSNYQNAVSNKEIAPNSAAQQQDLAALAQAYEAAGQGPQAEALRGLSEIANDPAMPTEAMATIQQEVVRSFTNDGNNPVNVESAIRAAGELDPALAQKAYGAIAKGAEAAKGVSPEGETAKLDSLQTFATQLADPELTPEVRKQLSLGFNRSHDLSSDFLNASNAATSKKDLQAIQAFMAARFPDQADLAGQLQTAIDNFSPEALAQYKQGLPTAEAARDTEIAHYEAELETQLSAKAGHPVDIKFDDDGRLSADDRERELNLIRDSLGDSSFDSMWAKYDTIEFNTFEDRSDSGDSDNLNDYAQVDDRTLKLNNAADDGLTDVELDKQRRSLAHVRDTGEGT